MKYQIKVSESFGDCVSMVCDILEYRLHNSPKCSSIYENCTVHIPDLIYKYRFSTKLIKAKYSWVIGATKYQRPRFIISVAYNEYNQGIGVLMISGINIDFYVNPANRHEGVASALFSETASYYDLTRKLINHENNPAIEALRNKFRIAKTYEELRSHKFYR